MKKLQLLSFILLIGYHSYSQFGPQQIISSTTERPYYSIPLDIDNDGYIDILKSSLEDYKLQWQRNLDGEGVFGPNILISDNPAYYLSLDFVDLDSDGDKDILYLENNPRLIGWFENLDGLGNFSEEQIIIENQPDFISSVKATDIDNDGDLDLISKRTNTFIDKLVWHENIDGSANFSEEIILIDDVFEVNPPLLVDINNDGLRDILTSNEISSLGPAKLVWYQNLGNIVYGSEQIIYEFPFMLSSDWTSICCIQYVDVNTDDKNDIVIISHNDDIGTFYHWFENLDNKGNFGSIQSLPISGIFCDIDNDGDNDILTGRGFVNRIYWIENSDGLGNFTTERTISTEIDGLTYLAASDINGDGLIDVVSASRDDDKIAWYENTGILGISEMYKQQFVIYPNPAQDVLRIENTSTYKITSIRIYDVLGRLVLVEKETFSQLNVSNLNSGLLFVEIETDQGVVNKKIIKE